MTTKEKFSKFCHSCEQEKDIAEFGMRTGGKYRNSYCKPCIAKRKKAWQVGKKKLGEQAKKTA